MQTLLTDLAGLLLVLCLTAVVFWGWGTLACRVLKINLPQSDKVTVFWVGFVVVLGWLKAIHFLWPIDWRVTTATAVIGLFGVCLKPPFSGFAKVVLLFKRHYGWLISCCAVLILVCLRAMGEPNNFDSGLYHFQTIRWLNEYPLTPGLGNLHWRLGLNQSYFEYLAFLNFSPFYNHGYAAGGLFLLLLTVGTVFEFVRHEGPWARWTLTSLLLLALGYYAATISSPVPDTAVAFIEIVIFLTLIRFFNVWRLTATGGVPLSEQYGSVVLLLCVVAPMIKLSSAVFAACSGLIVLLMYVSHYWRAIYGCKRMLLLLVVMLFLYVASGYVLSGYPLIPAGVGGWSELFWAMPSKVLEYETQLIYSWARTPGVTDPALVLGNWQWFGPWLSALPMGVWLPTLLATVLGLCNAFQFKRAPAADKSLFLLYLPLLAALMFWFMTAPDPRFIGVVPVLYLSLSCLLCIRLNRAQQKNYAASWIVSKPLIRFIFCVALGLVCIKQLGLRSVSLNGWVAIPQPVLQEQLLKQNVRVLTALTNAQCWNAPLPCAAAFNRELLIDWYSFGGLGTQLGLGRYVFSVR